MKTLYKIWPRTALKNDWYSIEEIDIEDIKARAFAHRSYDKNNNFIWRIALNKLKRETITEEEKDQAMKEFEELKQAKIKSIKNWQLVFVWMGAENETEVWNHRFRTEIVKQNWQKYFIELTTWTDRTTGKQRLFIDHSIDRTQQELYNKIVENLLKKWRNNRTKENHEKYKEYNKQPYHWYKTEEWNKFLEWEEPTKKIVLELVNMLYDTRFYSVEIENNLLTTDDYVSEEKKFF